MKVAVLLLLCLTAGSQASFLDDLKAAFHNIGTSLTTTFHAVGDQAKVVGQNLLSTAKEQGSQLASQALQSENLKKPYSSARFVEMRSLHYLFQIFISPEWRLVFDVLCI